MLDEGRLRGRLVCGYGRAVGELLLAGLGHSLLLGGLVAIGSDEGCRLILVAVLIRANIRRALVAKVKVSRSQVRLISDHVVLVGGALSLCGNVIGISRSFSGIVHVKVVLASLVDGLTSLRKLFQLLFGVELLSGRGVHD